MYSLKLWPGNVQSSRSYWWIVLLPLLLGPGGPYGRIRLSPDVWDDRTDGDRFRYKHQNHHTISQTCTFSHVFPKSLKLKNLLKREHLKAFGNKSSRRGRQKTVSKPDKSTVREIERLHRRRFKLHQVEISSEKIPAWRVLEWSCLFQSVSFSS